MVIVVVAAAAAAAVVVLHIYQHADQSAYRFHSYLVSGQPLQSISHFLDSDAPQTAQGHLRTNHLSTILLHKFKTQVANTGQKQTNTGRKLR